MEWVLPAVGFLLLVSGAAVSVAAYACHMAIKALIEVKALQNSTHNIQFVPAETPADDDDESLNRALDKGDMEAFQRLHDIHDRSDPLM